MQKLVTSVLLGGSIVAVSATGGWGWQSSPLGAFVAIDPGGDIVVASGPSFQSPGPVPPGYGWVDRIAKVSGRDGTELWRNSTFIPDLTRVSAVLDPAGDVLAARGFPRATGRGLVVVVKLSGTGGAELWRHELQCNIPLPRFRPMPIYATGDGDLI